jgi:hypothetical protein
VPGEGSCEITIPSSDGSLVSSCCTFTLKPDATSWLRAVSMSVFSTFGTPVVCGPFDTVSVTVEPLDAKLPPAGCCSITMPAAAALESTSLRATAKPSACSCEAAESYELPRTSGIPIGLGPLETLIRTFVFSVTFTPPFGSCAMTVSAGWVEEILCTSATRFLRVSAATASLLESPTTFGTTTCGLPVET